MNFISRFSAIPPVAAPVMKRVWFDKWSHHNFKIQRRQLDQILTDYFGSVSSYPLCSGRAALFLLLSALKENSKKREVVLPAYTCPVVYFALRKAGLHPKFLDIDRGDLGLDYHQLDKISEKNTLAVVTQHLFGIPSRVDKLVSLCDRIGIPVIEDIAQSIGAEKNQKKIGSFGEFAFFSLGKGKVLTADEGGVILVNKNRGRRSLEEAFQRVDELSKYEKIGSLVRLLVYPWILRSFSWWIVENTFINPEFRETPEDFKVKLLSQFQMEFATAGLQILDQINRVRIQNGLYLMDNLKGFQGIAVPKIAENDKAVFLRFPVIFNHPPIRDKVYHKLREEGLGVSKMIQYQMTVDIAESYGTFSNARYVCEGLMTLPTHYLVKQNHLDRILSIIDEYI